MNSLIQAAWKVWGPGERRLAWQRVSRVLYRVALYLALSAFVLLWLVPIFGTLLTAVRTMDDIIYNGFWSLPKPLDVGNFARAWDDGNLRRYLPNTFVVTMPALLGTLFLSSLAAYALARFNFRGSRVVLMIFMAGMMLPFQILMLPIFRLTNLLKIYDTYWALIIIHLSYQLGFCTFVLRNFMRTVPTELLDAARIDGCNEFGIWRSIVMPLTVPALAALGTLEFTWIFNDYLWALILLRTDELKPVAAGLASLQGQFLTSWNVLAAGSLVASIPTILVFIFLQRYFLSGLTLGAFK